MIAFATLNVQGAGAAKVNMLADLLDDVEFPVDVLAVQELNLDVLSAPSFVAVFKDRGIHVFLCAEDGGVYRCAVLAKLAGVAIGMCSCRLAGAVFELLCNGSFIKVVIASYYGCVWDSSVAMQGALDAVEQLRSTGAAWVLEPAAEPLAAHLARGFAVPWDADFETVEALPGTRATGRRLDFALGCGLVPTGLRQRWVFSDHAQVCYEVDLSSPAACCGPSFGDLRKDQVTVEAWTARWDAEAFRRALEADDLDLAWAQLSDAAEDLLRDPGSACCCRRSSLWRPCARLHPRSKAGQTKEPLVLVRLRRLVRRLRQLARDPDHGRLRDKAARQLDALVGSCGWLAEVPYFQMELWADFVADHIDRMEAEQKAAALRSWRERMAESEGKVIAWIRRRELLKVELERPCMPPAEVHNCKALHPTQVLKEAEDGWMRLWGRAGTTGHVPTCFVHFLLFLSLRGNLPLPPRIFSRRARRWLPKLQGRMDGPRVSGACFLCPFGRLWRRSGLGWWRRASRLFCGAGGGSF